MELPSISVCIVTYNHERYIHDCIMSVIAQVRDFDLEILVGDDCSADRTGSIVEALAQLYPQIIKYYKNEVQLGPSANYQNLISRASGVYIAHLDGDDYWLPGKLNNQFHFLQNNPACSAVYTNALCMQDDGNFIGVFNNPQPESFNLVYLLRRGNFLNHSSLVYRASLRGKILTWDKFIDYRIHIHLAEQGLLGYINACGVVYRVGASTSMLVHQIDYVRECYWQAICELPIGLDDRFVALRAAADFLQRILFQAIQKKSFHLMLDWWIKVNSFHRDRKSIIIIFLAAHVAVSSVRLLRRWVSGVSAGFRLKVIFWR